MIKEWLDSEEFYNLMQTYRHWSLTDQGGTSDAYEAVKASIEIQVEDLQAQRDELLAALIDVRDNVKEDSPEMWMRVDEIIAKVKA